MARLPKLPHVKYVKRGPKVYAYFNTGVKADGKAVMARLPEPGSVGFHDSYARHMGTRSRRASTAYTVAKLVQEYEDSNAFARLAANTRRAYGQALLKIVKELGAFPVSSIERRHVRAVLEAMEPTPGMHNLVLATMAVIYSWARERDKTTLRPTEGIKPLKTGSHEPWPAHVLAAGLASDNARIRLAVHLLYYTGQRIGDTCALRWDDVHGDVISLVQEKTDTEIDARLHSALRDELARTPRTGPTILMNSQGGAMKPSQLRKDLKAFTESMGVHTVPHGLRKNAVNALLEAGCTVAEVGAITGQSHQVVEHYAKRVNRKRLANAAIGKLENTPIIPLD